MQVHWVGSQGPLVGGLATQAALLASRVALLLLLAVLLLRAEVGTLGHLARPGAPLVPAEASLCSAAGSSVVSEDKQKAGRSVQLAPAHMGGR